MTKAQRRLMSPIAYAGTMVGGPQRIVPMCINQFKGTGWAVQVGEVCEPANIALVNASDGCAYQAIEDDPKIVIDKITKEQLAKVDEAIENMAVVALQSFLNASVMFTDFVSKKYPEFYKHMMEKKNESKD